MNLRIIRKKIKSIKNVRKITKAMQMISAIKMRKSLQQEIDGKPYRESLFSLSEKIFTTIDATYSPFLSLKRSGERQIILLISGNKGLAGSFNVGLFRFLLSQNLDLHKTDFVTLGSKGAIFISNIGGKILADFSSNHPQIQVPAIFSFIINQYLKNKDYKSVYIIYNKFISPLKSVHAIEKIIPLVEDNKTERKQNIKLKTYLIEPSPEQIIDYLLRSILEEKIRSAVISSEAVEHSMRMMAMKNATDNADNVIYNLTLVGNKLRQEKITNELLDMVTSKESVDMSN